MGYVKNEDIVAIQDNHGQVFCRDCMTDEEWKNLREVHIITQDDIENDDEGYYFCDRCQKGL